MRSPLESDGHSIFDDQVNVNKSVNAQDIQKASGFAPSSEG
jgi:hypothetical protein